MSNYSACTLSAVSALIVCAVLAPAEQVHEEYTEWFFAARFIGLPADIAWPSKPRQFGLEYSLRF